MMLCTTLVARGCARASQCGASRLWAPPRRAVAGVTGIPGVSGVRAASALSAVAAPRWGRQPLPHKVCGEAVIRRAVSTSVAAQAPAPKAGAKKRKKQWTIKKRRGDVYSLGQALQLAKSFAATSTFDETIELAVQLGVDPRKPNQNIRGVVQLPHGTGTTSVVAVFAKGAAAEEALAAGAHVVGGEDLVERISGGTIDFTTCIATPDMMALVGRVARILGPRGLMPNPKLGTITTNVTETVTNALRGQLEFRTEKRGIIHVPVGKASWDADKLRANIRVLMVALGNAKPEEARGSYLRHATLSTSSGRGIPVDIAVLNPVSIRFMRDDDPTAAAAVV